MREAKGAVLIVDDEEAIRDILSRVLDSEGYKCTVAADGREALQKSSGQEFDVVLLDIRMPELSGMEVLPQIVADHPDACVLMTTAVGDAPTAVEALNLGACDYLTKPFNLDDLSTRVEEALESKRQTTQRNSL